MNRRRFIQSLAAVLSLPANATLSLRSATAALPTAAAVPANARFWAIYMSALHGECTPKTLQNLLHIPEVDAKKYVSHLIADGVIKPNPLLQRSVSNFVKSNDESLLDKVKKRFEMKGQAEAEEGEACETADAAEGPDAEERFVDDVSEDDLPEDDLEVVAEEESVELETQIPEEPKVQN